MTYLGRFLTYFAAIFLLPLGLHAAWWTAHAHPASYMDADWSSAGVLPAASSVHEATVHVLAGRTGRWKGIFAHHTWVVVKPKGGRYTRYDVVGWGRPVRIDAYAPDGRWFGDTPQIVAVLKGEAAERAIPKIRDTVARYPFSAQGSYVVWPGPNSNTFAAAIARAVPELAAGLLPTAIGKDYAGPLLYAELTPSRTGFQISLRGLMGVSIGWVEGVELNMLGLVAGIDMRRPALKIPGWGRVGLPA